MWNCCGSKYFFLKSTTLLGMFYLSLTPNKLGPMGWCSNNLYRGGGHKMGGGGGVLGNRVCPKCPAFVFCFCPHCGFVPTHQHPIFHPNYVGEPGCGHQIVRLGCTGGCGACIKHLTIHIIFPPTNHPPYRTRGVMFRFVVHGDFLGCIYKK